MFVYCLECIYFYEGEHTPGFGQCRRKAPTPFIKATQYIGPINALIAWPYVRANDGCGEGELGKRKELPEETADQNTTIETLDKMNTFQQAIERARKRR